jgi:hypothetical protein
MPGRFPGSVRDLDPDRVLAALITCNVNVSKAAKQLGVPSAVVVWCWQALI